jgi:hypothetical protein
MGLSTESGFVHGAGHSSWDTRENLFLGSGRVPLVWRKRTIQRFWPSQMAYEIALKIERPTKLL